MGVVWEIVWERGPMSLETLKIPLTEKWLYNIWATKQKPVLLSILVGGFNPCEKYSSIGIFSSSKGEHKTCLKPQTSWWIFIFSTGIKCPKLRNFRALPSAWANMARTTSSWASMARCKICQSSTNERTRTEGWTGCIQQSNKWSIKAIAATDNAHPSGKPTSELMLGPTEVRTLNRLVWTVTKLIHAWMNHRGQPKTSNTIQIGSRGMQLNALTKSATTPTQWWSMRYACSMTRAISYQMERACLAGTPPPDPTWCKSLESTQKLLGSKRGPGTVKHRVDHNGTKLLHCQGIRGLLQGGNNSNCKLSWPLCCRLNLVKEREKSLNSRIRHCSQIGPGNSVQPCSWSSFLVTNAGTKSTDAPRLEIPVSRIFETTT